MKEETNNSCVDCGCKTNDICWPQQNELREKWLSDNPDSEYQGWMSI